MNFEFERVPQAIHRDAQIFRPLFSSEERIGQLQIRFCAEYLPFAVVPGSLCHFHAQFHTAFLIEPPHKPLKGPKLFLDKLLK